MTTRQQFAFVKGDEGCYVDGAFGEDHLREVLAEMMDSLGESELVADLEREPDDGTSDDTIEDVWCIQCEAIDNAIDVLQSNTEDGLVWTMEAGDLCLCDESELL